MISLIKSIWSIVNKQKVLNIIIIGEHQAGKTTLYKQIKNFYLLNKVDCLEDQNPSYGINTFEFIINKSFNTRFTEISYDSIDQSNVKDFYREATGIIIIIDINNELYDNHFQSIYNNILSDEVICDKSIPIGVVLNHFDQFHLRNNHLKILDKFYFKYGVLSYLILEYPVDVLVYHNKVLSKKKFTFSDISLENYLNKLNNNKPFISIIAQCDCKHNINVIEFISLYILQSQLTFYNQNYTKAIT